MISNNCGIDPDERLFKISAAAKLSSVCVQHIKHLIATNQIEVVAMGEGPKSYRISLMELQRYWRHHQRPIGIHYSLLR
jgi:hypothetical protein